MKINPLFALLLTLTLAACSTSNFRHQKYTHFNHAKGLKLSPQTEEIKSDEPILSDTELPKEQKNHMSSSNAEALENTSNGTGNSETDASFIPDKKQDPLLPDTLTVKESSAEVTNENTDTPKSERKILRGSRLSYGFLIAFFILVTLFLLSLEFSFLPDIAIIATWFLGPVALLVALTFMALVFFRGRKYLKNKKALGETPNEKVAQHIRANKIFWIVCGAAIVGLVIVVLIALSNI